MIAPKNTSILRAADVERDASSIPSFAEATRGEPSENPRDESKILSDQDQTMKADLTSVTTRKSSTNTELESLEDLPGDFMRGDIDVKEQMDRAASALDTSLRGFQNQADEDSPRGELGASFKNTPGGLEEVEEKTDQYLATHRRNSNTH